MVEQSEMLTPVAYLPSRREVRQAQQGVLPRAAVIAYADTAPTAKATAVPATAATATAAAAIAPALTSSPTVGTPALPDNPVAATDESATEPEKAPRSKAAGLLSFFRETVIIMISALAVSWLIKTLLVQAFFIPSESMEDTLEVGDRVIVSRMVPRFFDVNRGDIVVFTDPGDWLGDYIAPDRGAFGNAITTALTWVGLFPHDAGDHLIKRAIGVPGDHVMCCDNEGRIVLNGVPISEQLYIRPGAVPSQDPFDVTVPPDMLFVMGDNRQNSADSRYNQDKPYEGFVPINNVVGTAFVTVWPLNHLSWLRNPGSVFQGVPNP